MTQKGIPDIPPIPSTEEGGVEERDSDPMGHKAMKALAWSLVVTALVILLTVASLLAYAIWGSR